MASNRSSTEPDPTATPRNALATVARHGARIQIAALTAAGKAIAGWAHAVDRLADAVGDELLRRVDGESDSAELVVRVASATNAHLREVATLPRTAADHFDTRLSPEGRENHLD